MKLQGSREEKAGTTVQTWSKEVIEGCKVAEEICEEKPWGRMQGQEPGQQQVLGEAQEGDQQGATKPWRSPAWLVLSWACRVYFCTDFPGSEGSSAYFCL